MKKALPLLSAVSTDTCREERRSIQSREILCALNIFSLLREMIIQTGLGSFVIGLV